MWNLFFKSKFVKQFLGLTLLFACFLSQSVMSEEDGVPTHKFKRIKQTELNFFALKSVDTLKQYSKIRYFPMSSKTLVLKKSGDSDIDRSWRIAKPEDWLKITSAFDDMAKEYFPADKLFGFTDTAGSDVLSVQVRLAEYTPRVSRYGELGSATIGTQESRNYGEVLVVVMLVDSLTNETVGIASEGLSLGAGDLLAKSSSPSSQLIGWQRSYSILLKKLKNQLEISHKD